MLSAWALTVNLRPKETSERVILYSILKSRDITLLTKIHLVKAMVFPVIMYGCESWIIKKAERWRIDAFELWCWRKTLESSLDCKEIKPVNPKGNEPWIFIQRTDAEAPVLWPPTLVFLPGEFHGQRSLVGYSPWGWKESDMTEWLTLTLSLSLSS